MDISTQIANTIATQFPNRPTLTYTEAAKVLAAVTGVAVSATTIKTYVKQGKLSPVKVSTFAVIPIESLIAIKFSAPAPRPATAKKPGRKPAEGAAK